MAGGTLEETHNSELSGAAAPLSPRSPPSDRAPLSARPAVPDPPPAGPAAPLTRDSRAATPLRGCPGRAGPASLSPRPSHRGHRSAAAAPPGPGRLRPPLPAQPHLPGVGRARSAGPEPKRASAGRAPEGNAVRTVRPRPAPALGAPPVGVAAPAPRDLCYIKDAHDICRPFSRGAEGWPCSIRAPPLKMYQLCSSLVASVQICPQMWRLKATSSQGLESCTSEMRRRNITWRLGG